LPFVLDRNDLARLRVVAKARRIRHSDELVFDEGVIKRERPGHYRIESLLVRPVGDDEKFAIYEAIRARRKRWAGQRHREGAGKNISNFMLVC
jgi:hypothetical protein